MLKIIWIIACFGVALLAKAQAPTPPPPDTSGRAILSEQGFSILPPSGWAVNRNAGGSSLLFLAPKKNEDVSYQATIQVMVFSGHRYIDDLTQNEYGKIIVDKFSKVSNRVINYRLRSQDKIKMESGDDAILYYTEFQYDDIPIMQMHILISSGDHHFLMTYTDLSKNFEKENSEELATAYASMHSARVQSKPPTRYDFPIIIGISLGSLLILGLSFRAFRSYQLQRLSERLEDEDHEDTHSDDESRYYQKRSKVEEADEDVSGSKLISEPPKKKPKASKPRPHRTETREEEVDVSGADTWSSEATVLSTAPAPKAPPPPSRTIPPAVPVSALTQSSSPTPPPRPLTTEAESAVARLSEILPQNGDEADPGTKKKRKGFFWRKDAEEVDPHSDVAESWAVDANQDADEKPLSQAWQGEEADEDDSPPPPAKAKPQSHKPKTSPVLQTKVQSARQQTIAQSEATPLSEDAWNLGAHEGDRSDDEDEDEDDRV